MATEEELLDWTASAVEELASELARAELEGWTLSAVELEAGAELEATPVLRGTEGCSP
jgi:DNA-binding IclR family transcriptional regulator